MCQALKLRGYEAADADREFGYQDELGWFWNKDKIGKAINDISTEVLFICGSASNREEYIFKFSKVFILYVDDETLEHRLLGRTNNNFGKDSVVLARQIQNNQGIKEYSVKRGRVPIDATQTLEKVVDEILDKADC